MSRVVRDKQAGLWVDSQSAPSMPTAARDHLLTQAPVSSWGSTWMVCADGQGGGSPKRLRMLGTGSIRLCSMGGRHSLREQADTSGSLADQVATGGPTPQPATNVVSVYGVDSAC